MSESESTSTSAMPASIEAPESVSHWVELIRDWNASSAGERLIPVGRCSKPGLSLANLGQDSGSKIDSPASSLRRVSTRNLSGILQHDPSEFTISVASGTPLKEVIAALAKHGQTLPFDPPRAGMGATIGGCVASGWSGPGRWRYGGLRDFILAASFLDGLGNEVHTGAPVVKNAAGFDFPKLMVGSLGRLGVLTRLTFKVFPQSVDPQTWAVKCGDLAMATRHMQTLTRLPIELDAIELCQPGMTDPEDWCIVLRVPGPPSVAKSIMDRVRETVGQAGSLELSEEHAQKSWSKLLDVPGEVSVRIPITPRQIETAVQSFPQELTQRGWKMHFGLAGNVMFVTGAGDLTVLDAWLMQHSLAGLVLDPGETNPLGTQIGMWRHDEVVVRVSRAIDPHRCFAPFQFGEPKHTQRTEA
ncbi:Glycolate dehydrogenase [Rhodopirellula islandica]|uniref:Glycolate dehydrogenase n=1 Tax=Rhodopirellula islandica TaxID=595434 RepID=A0A0J1BMC0_RHOIS|nr:FAD-binding protein [Rhodopirellula islandica]KLU07632.1 Glycolate dehydrogenase [Rhodopirellula islandica]